MTNAEFAAVHLALTEDNHLDARGDSVHGIDHKANARTVYPCERLSFCFSNLRNYAASF
jgi:hypothetical protein